MPEVIVNTSDMNEINDAMNFETELIKSKGRVVVRNEDEAGKKKKMGLEGLFKKFINLKISSNNPSLKKLKLPSFSSSSSDKNDKFAKKKKRMFEGERLKVWDEIGMKESRDFYKSDQLAKLKLSKIIPSEISRRR